MSFFQKTRLVIVCDRCGVGRKFDTDKTEQIEDILIPQGWEKKEDRVDMRVKHYCPNCMQEIEQIEEAQDDEDNMRVEKVDEEEKEEEEDKDE